MAGKANYTAIVGGGKQPKFAQNKARMLKDFELQQNTDNLAGGYLGRC